jgi:hypothetical protein
MLCAAAGCAESSENASNRAARARLRFMARAGSNGRSRLLPSCSRTKRDARWRMRRCRLRRPAPRIARRSLGPCRFSDPPAGLPMCRSASARRWLGQMLGMREPATRQGQGRASWRDPATAANRSAVSAFASQGRVLANVVNARAGGILCRAYLVATRAVGCLRVGNRCANQF